MRAFVVAVSVVGSLGCNQAELEAATQKASTAERELAAAKLRIVELEGRVAELSQTDTALFGKASAVESANDLEEAIKLYGELQEKFPASGLAAESKQRVERINAKREAVRKEGQSALKGLDSELKLAPDGTAALSLIDAFEKKYPLEEFRKLLEERREPHRLAAKAEADAKAKGLLLFKPGVGVLGRLALCESSARLLKTFGRPTKVEETNNIWSGLVDDYEFTKAGEHRPWLLVRVRKKTDQVTQILATADWVTTEGIRPGDNELQMVKVYGRCRKDSSNPFANTGFDCATEGRAVYFGLGDEVVRAPDERGLPRDVGIVSSVRLIARTCPLPAPKASP